MQGQENPEEDELTLELGEEGLTLVPAETKESSESVEVAEPGEGEGDVELFGAGTAMPWTTVGSAGIVDEADLGIVEFSEAHAMIKAPQGLFAPANLDLRYNIVSVDGLVQGLPGFRMTVRYRDNGAGARVIVRLKEHNYFTGAQATLMTFDSDAFGANAAIQTRQIDGCNVSFDFNNKAYFLDVTIQKTLTYGTPLLSAVALRAQICIP